jgi:hypothetical protein
MENKNMNEMMKKLDDAVKYAKEVRAMNKANTEGGGVTKMYASRRPTSVTQWYLEDIESKEIIKILQDAIYEAFNLNPSRTIIIRRALRAYSDKFLAFMLTGQMSNDLAQFLVDLEAEKKAIIAVKKR